MIWDVVIVGAGAAGLIAATVAADRGRRVLLLEKNNKAGVKILMSGGSRCNLTQHTDRRGIIDAFGKQGRFLHSSLAALDPQGLVDWVEAEGVATKVESTGKVFPESNRAADVLQAFLSRLSRSGATLLRNEPLLGVQPVEGGFQLNTPRQQLQARMLLITTGGQSYPKCGTSGDGYAWAEALGHTVHLPRPALVPLRTDAQWPRSLQGITIPDAGVRIVQADGRCLAKARGGLLFAHFGLSGPAVLDVSRAVSGGAQPQDLQVQLDLLPNQSAEQLQGLLQRAPGGSPVLAALTPWLPQRLAEQLGLQAHVPRDTRAAELRKQQRRQLVSQLKSAPIHISGTLGFSKAEVTAGGVALDEVDSRTMQSRRTPGLFFAGEVLDLDGPIGGYNFQAAFSTGYLAGLSISE